MLLGNADLEKLKSIRNIVYNSYSLSKYSPGELTALIIKKFEDETQLCLSLKWYLINMGEKTKERRIRKEYTDYVDAYTINGVVNTNIIWRDLRED